MINQQKTYTVYEHVNKVNGKRYIGTTSQKPEKRWGWKGSGYFNQPFWEGKHYLYPDRKKQQIQNIVVFESMTH